MTCGVPLAIWNEDQKPLAQQQKATLPGGVMDWFYHYQPMPFDDGGSPPGYFGYKVLAVSYGGSLKLNGKKGATYSALPASSSGTSWTRLTEGQSVASGESALSVDGDVKWQSGDDIVVTSTDYVPGHAEQRRIQSAAYDAATNSTRITVTQKFDFAHNGKRYPLKDRVPSRIGLDFEAAETRAAVALLTRSIRISSGGDRIDDPFPDPSTHYHFGGHTLARQGFAAFEVQGVEFKQLGQGGRLGHYPVHFHMARVTPHLDPSMPQGSARGTLLKDCSINESMTRWVVLHATHHVVLARNVGWQSIGHGFLLEEGTEIENRFQANIGILARAAVINDHHNPRQVPGIYAASQPSAGPPFVPPEPAAVPPQEKVPFFSDYDHPTTFWIMNGWNDFEYNVAAGAATCGMCYWLLPGANSGHSRHMRWESYAAMQHGVSVMNAKQVSVTNDVYRAGMTPLKKFVGNSCVGAMTAFTVNGNQSPCLGVAGPPADVHLEAVANPLAPAPCNQENLYVDDPGFARQKYNCNEAANAMADMYYPKIGGGGRLATLCDGTEQGCSTVDRCSDGAPEVNCAVTVLDHFTTQFNWAQTNFGAVLLRPQWSLMHQNVIADVQNAGASLVTGGGYTHSDTINGLWEVAKKTVFVGQSQSSDPVTGNPYASDAGPFNKDTAALGFTCENNNSNFCLSRDQAITFLLDNFANNQRFFNIYDGPSYQESNAYLDIRTRVIDDCTPFPDNPNPGNCFSSKFMYGRVPGLPFRQTATAKETYLPNAAIAWKQPNGFYYPPAFHSDNLYFDAVDIRHFVIEPLFATGTQQFVTAPVSELQTRYSTYNPALFEGFTDVDRQTELNDDDGSLTGYSNTISVNMDPYFNAAVEAVECKSDATAKTSPYEYVSTVVYPDCARATQAPFCAELDWATACSNQFCFGVPLYRQLLTASEMEAGARPSAKMMGQNIAQRSILTVNNGVYYLDTTTNKDAQLASRAAQLSVFQPNQTYNVFLLFAKKTTKQIYQIYVGANSGFDPASGVSAVRVNVDAAPLKITSSATWPGTWKRCFDATTGILTVEIDMSFPEAASAFDDSAQDRCRPLSFCRWNPALAADPRQACTCRLAAGDLNYAACSDKNVHGLDVCSWAVKDFDCPRGGCYGFSFKLPASFSTAQAVDRKPAAGCFPSDATWNVTFAPAQNGVATDCTGSPVDPSKSCANVKDFRCSP